MTNIKDVAKYCKVSAMTVSRALNDSTEISESTREKILEVCKKLNYKPNAAAISLITKRTKMIGLIIPDIANQYYANISKGVSINIEKQGYGLILCNSDRKKTNENKYLNFLVEGRVDGIIILPVNPKKEDYSEFIKHVPMVIADNYVEGLDMTFVGNDNYYGASKIIKHMVMQGYKKIGVILGDKTSTASNDRYRAYKDMLNKNNITPDLKLVVNSNATFEDGYNLAGMLISQGVDSIFAINDTVAMGVIKYCFVNNIKIPIDLGLAGYDNIEQSSMLTVPLTTVDQNNKQIGRLASELLLCQIKGETIKNKINILKPRLVIRKSCGEK